MRNHTAPSTANEDVASLYYGTVHACFFRQHESSSCIFLEDCENAQDAMGRLATQQAHIDSKIGSFAETEGRLLVDAVLDVCSIRQGYSILLRGLEDARNKVCSTKSVLSTMPRDVRGLLFEQKVASVYLEFLKQILECKNCENIVGRLLEERHFDVATETVLQNLKFVNRSDVSGIVAVQLLVLKNEIARDKLLRHLCDAIGILLYSNVEPSEETELKTRKDIRSLSSYLHRIVATTVSGDNPDTTISASLYQLELSQNAQREIHTRFCHILRRHVFKGFGGDAHDCASKLVRDNRGNSRPTRYDRNTQKRSINFGISPERRQFYHLIDDLLSTTIVYMERFWYFFIGGGVGVDVNLNSLPDGSWKSSNRRNQALLLLWYTVQTDIIDILRRHYEYNEFINIDSGTNKWSSIKQELGVPSSSKNASFTNENRAFSFSGSKLWPSSEDIFTTDGIGTQYFQDKNGVTISDEFSRLLLCEPSPYHSIEVNPLVRKVSNSIDSWVHAWSGADLHGLHDVETLDVFVQKSNDLVCHCVKTGVTNDASVVCDGPSAFDATCAVFPAVNNNAGKIFSSAPELIFSLKNWTRRIVLDCADGNDELVSILKETIQVVLDRYLRRCKRLLEEQVGASCSRKRFEDYSIALPHSGKELSLRSFLSWVRATLSNGSRGNEIDVDGDELFSTMADLGWSVKPVDACSSTNRDWSYSSASFLEYCLMEKNIFPNTKSSLLPSESTLFRENTSLLPLSPGLDLLACIHTSLLWIIEETECLEEDFKSYTHCTTLFVTRYMKEFADECLYLVHISMRLRCHWHFNLIFNGIHNAEEPRSLSCNTISSLCNDLSVFINKIYLSLKGKSAKFCAQGLETLLSTMALDFMRQQFNLEQTGDGRNSTAFNVVKTKQYLVAVEETIRCIDGHSECARIGFRNVEKILALVSLSLNCNDHMHLANNDSLLCSFEVDCMKGMCARPV